MKNFLISFLILFLLFSSCSKEKELSEGGDARAPKFSKELIKFDKEGGTETISVDMNITFLCEKIKSTNFGYTGILTNDDRRDTCNIYKEEDGFVYKIETEWFSLVRTKKNPKALEISVKPILEDLKYRKNNISFFGRELYSKIVIEQINSKNNKNYVSIEEAKSIAVSFMNSFYLNKNKVQNSTRVLSAMSCKPIAKKRTASRNADLKEKNIEIDDVMYSINFEHGGFAIVSADNRTIPVYYFSENGKFDSKDIDKIPSGMISIVENAYAHIIDFKKHSTSKIEVSKAKCVRYNAQRITNEVFPKCKVLWGQKDPFNKYCFTKKHKKAFVGCAATAAAQAYSVLQINNFIGEYKLKSSWREIEESPHIGSLSFIAQEDIARMMAEIGRLIGMHYGAIETSKGSSASTGKAAKLICNGSPWYTYSTKHKYILPVLKSSNGVVILDGCHTKIYHGTKWLGTRRAIYKNGHSMLIDGFIAYRNGTTFLHVNYGTADGFDNGYFLDYDSNAWTKTAIEGKNDYPYKMTYYSIARRYIFKIY